MLVALCAVIVPILLVLIAAYWKQNLLLYNNNDGKDSFIYLPSRYNMPFEEIWLKTRDGVKIHCWLIRFSNESSSVDKFLKTPTIVYFHGNGGNISHRLITVKELFAHNVHANVFMVEYRGFGKSEGSPSEHGLKLDAEAALAYLYRRNDINSQNIFLFGRSLGGSVVLHLYHQLYQMNPNRYICSGLILENTFTSIDDMIDLSFPYLKYFKWLNRNKWRNLDIIDTLPRQLPVLFLSGCKDELVPPTMMKQLYKNCSSGCKQYVEFAEGNHNETWMQPEYNETIHRFLEQYNMK